MKRRTVRLFNDFQFFKKDVVFGFFSDIEDESYIFAVFGRRTSVWIKAVFFAVAGLQFMELMEERAKLRLRWKCNMVTVDIYITVCYIMGGLQVLIN